MTPLDHFKKCHTEIAQWRQALHAMPELLFDLPKTTHFVAEKLRSFGIEEVDEGVGRSGIVAIVKGTRPGGNHTIGLRADMDALPISEASGLPYASRIADRMHACGHDGHTAMLLGAARYFAENRDFSGTIAFIFQPAEEGGVGAKAMLDDGLVDRYGLTEIYGLHNRPGLPVGCFGSRPAELMASGDNFRITLTGVGGHAARPHQCVDPLLAASHVHIALHGIVSREIDPAKSVVLSVTQIHGGDAVNVIPQEAVLVGTIRSLDSAARDFIEGRLGEVVQHTAQAHRCSADIRLENVVPVTKNSPICAEHAAKAARAVAGADQVDMNYPLNMGGEDFSFMLEKVPGAHMFLGQGSGPGLHHPEYDFNDEIIPYGCAYWVTLAKDRLGTTP